MDLLSSMGAARRSDLMGYSGSCCDAHASNADLMHAAALRDSEHHQLLSSYHHLQHQNALMRGSAWLGYSGSGGSHSSMPFSSSRGLESLVSSTGTVPYYLVAGDQLGHSAYSGMGGIPHGALYGSDPMAARMSLLAASGEHVGMSNVGDLLIHGGHHPLHIQETMLAGPRTGHTDLAFSGFTGAPLFAADRGIQLLGDAALGQLAPEPNESTKPERKKEIVLSKKSTAEEKSEAQKREKRIYRHESFVEKLYRLLIDLEGQGKESVASFTGDGQGFCVHNPEEFVKDIAPKYFRHRKMSSFHRQLLLYKFDRVRDGPDRGSFHHKFFKRGHADLLKYIERDDKNDKLPIGYQKS